MSNDMKLIMESWRANVILNEQEMLEEQLLLEGFFSDLMKLPGEIKNTFSVAKQLMQDQRKIAKFVPLLYDKVIQPSMEKVREVFEKAKGAFTKDKEDESNSSLISGVVNKITQSINSVDKFLKSIPRTSWKKAAVAIGMAVVIKYFAFETLMEMPIEKGIEAVMEFFNEEIMGFLNKFLGEALIESLTGALTGGIATLVSVISKIVKGTSFIAETLAPAIEPFQTGQVSLTKLEEQII